MNIGSLSIPTSSPLTRLDVDVAVLSKSLDTIEQLGQSMIKMMEQSVSPHLGQNIDLMV